MLKNIQKLSAIIAILFLGITLILAMLIIWDVVDSAEARDAMIKTALSFGSIFVVSLLVLFVVKMVDKDESK